MIDTAYLHETVRRYVNSLPYQFMGRTYKMDDPQQRVEYEKEIEDTWLEIYENLATVTALRNGTSVTGSSQQPV